MIKKVGVERLRVGMYIHDLNCDWMKHGFMRSRFLIKAEPELSRIRQLGLEDILIDTDKGLDETPASPDTGAPGRTPSGARPERGGRADDRPTTLAAERVRAKRIHSEALGVVTGLMEDVRLGRQVDLERANPVVGEMVGSIFRNRDALLGLSRIRHMDRYTFEHSVNVAVLMVSLAHTLELERSLVESIGLGALLHDIGKTKTPPKILNKPGALTNEEFAAMRMHVVHSHDILAQAPGIPEAALAVAAEHHERIDGSGYPDRKAGSEISEYGRMSAIVDVYDAITSDRVYHRGMLPHQALRKLLEWSNGHFELRLVQHFIRCVGIYPVGTLVRLQSDRLAIVMESGRGDPLMPIVRLVFDAKHRRYIQVEDLDLSRKSRGAMDKIVAPEDPQRWGVDLEALMQLPLH